MLTWSSARLIHIFLQSSLTSSDPDLSGSSACGPRWGTGEAEYTWSVPGHKKKKTMKLNKSNVTVWPNTKLYFYFFT